MKIFFTDPSSETSPYTAQNACRNVSYLSEPDEGYESRTNSPENVVKDENRIKHERLIKAEPTIKQEYSWLVEQAMQWDC